MLLFILEQGYGTFLNKLIDFRWSAEIVASPRSILQKKPLTQCGVIVFIRDMTL